MSNGTRERKHSGSSVSWSGRLRNPEARKLASKTCALRIVRPRKGKGSFTRKQKHPSQGLEA